MADLNASACHGLYPAFDLPGLVPALSVLHCATLSVFAVSVKVMYDSVQIGHPVFAVIFQEVIVMLVADFIDLIILLAMTVFPTELLLVAYFGVARIAMQFHPITWAVVSYLRYYLHVKRQPGDDVSMNELRRRSLKTVWLLFIPFLLTAQVLAQGSIISQGWPRVSVRNLDRDAIAYAVVSGSVVNNVADVVSIAFYLVMRRHFKTAVQPAEPEQEGEGDDVQVIDLELANDGYYGGIWVGDVAEVPPEIDHDVVPHINHDNAASHEVHAVMRALRWHLALAAVDVAFSALSFFGCSVYLAYAFYLTQLACFYWVPFLVVKNGVKQLDGMVEYLRNCYKSCVS